MAQQNIDFGSFPNDPAADAIRAAFQKVQNNFTDLYATTLSTGVIEIVAGTGLDQNRTVGNVSITANISNIRLYTGSSNSLVFGTSSTPTQGNVTTTSSITPIYIDLAPNITTANANFTGSLRTANFTTTGTVTSSLIPTTTNTYNLGNTNNKWNDIYIGNLLSANFVSGTLTSSSQPNITSVGTLTSLNITSNLTSANGNFTTSLRTANFSITGFVNNSFIPGQNEVYDLGSANYRWKDLYLSGNSLSLGAVTVTSSSGALVVPNVTVTSNISAGNISSGLISGNLTTAIQPNITSVGTLSSLTVSGTANVGTLTAGNLSSPGSNQQVLFNDSGNLGAVPGLTFNKANTLLTIQGNVSSGNLALTGNASITGNIGVNGVVASGNVEGGNITTLGIVSASNGVVLGKDINVNYISGNGTALTILFSAQPTVPFPAGSLVELYGASPSEVNKTYTVTTGTTGSIVVPSDYAYMFTGFGSLRGGGDSVINGVLEVYGNTSVGNITAVDSITGNAITLTGNVDSGNLLASGIIQVVGTANLGAIFSPGDSNVANSLVRGSFGATGAATFAGTITANNTATFNAPIIANSNVSVNGTFIAASGSIGGFTISNSGNLNGNTFTAELFSGNGSQITFINAANVSGTVANATYSTSAGSATTATTAGTITTAAQPNITSVGTLSTLSVTGDISTGSAGSLTVGSYLKLSISNSISANGANQSTATAISKQVNIVTSVSSGTGVRLPVLSGTFLGVPIYVVNDTNSSIVVYPASGAYIDAQAQNTGFGIGAYGRMTFISGTSSKWYTMTSIYA